jgi:hypothetical protein
VIGRRFFVKALGALVVSVSTAAPMLNRRQSQGDRPWTPELPWEVIYIAQPKNISWGIQPFSQRPQRIQLQIPPWWTEAQRRQAIADAYHFPVERWDLHARMFGIKDRPKA